MVALEPRFIRSIREELAQVESILDREMLLRPGHVYTLGRLELNCMDKYLHPAATLLTARAFGEINERILALACVSQFIYLAATVHRDAAEEPTYQTLVGDFLYAQFFSFLCRYDAIDWLAPLATVICEMNEASVLDEQRGGNSIDNNQVEKKYGILLSQTCTLCAREFNVSPKFERAVDLFARNTGNAWGILKEPGLKKTPLSFLNRSRDSLFLFPQGPAREDLEKLLDHLAGWTENTLAV